MRLAKNNDPISLTTIINKAIRDCDEPFTLKAETTAGITCKVMLTCQEKTAVLRVDGDNTFIEDASGARLMPVFATAGAFPVQAPIALVMHVAGLPPQKARNAPEDDDPDMDDLLAIAKGKFIDRFALTVGYDEGLLAAVLIEATNARYTLSLDYESFTVSKGDEKDTTYDREEDDAASIFIAAWK